MPRLLLKNMVIGSVLCLLVLPFFALGIENPLGEKSTFVTLADRILDFLLILVGPISAIVVLYAGFLYMTSSGNMEKVKRAHQALVWALVGIAIVLLAKGIVSIIDSVLKGK